MVAITDRGPMLSESEIAAFEAEVGATLPADYREFLLTWNGGRPVPDTIDVPSGSIFCLSLERGEAGSTSFVDLQSVSGDLEAPPTSYEVASNFTEFLTRLRPPE